MVNKRFSNTYLAKCKRYSNEGAKGIVGNFHVAPCPIASGKFDARCLCIRPSS